MEFATVSQRKCYEKTESWLKECFGAALAIHPKDPMFQVKVGSAIVLTAVLSWGDEDAIISIFAIVVDGADITPECKDYLLQRNREMLFGSFAVVGDRKIILKSNIVGSTCDKLELQANVLAVAATADQEDDKIRERWGGQRAEDVLNVQRES